MILFCIWLFLISALTFAFWLRPQGLFGAKLSWQRNETWDLYMLASLSLGIIFFISFFALGCWLSLLNVKGLS